MSLPTNKTKPGGAAPGFEETVRAYDRELHGFLLRRLQGQGESPEDVRQEIYLRMLRFADAELVREPRAYLYRVARNVLHDKLLLMQRQPTTTDETIENEGPGEDEVTRADNQRDMKRIVNQLPPLYRAILILRIREGMSYGEIAKQLALSVHTVKKYLHLALVQCRLIGLGLK